MTSVEKESQASWHILVKDLKIYHFRSNMYQYITQNTNEDMYWDSKSVICVRKINHCFTTNKANKNMVTVVIPW